MAENTQTLNFESKKLLKCEQFECAVRLEAEQDKPIKKILAIKALPKITSSEKVGENISFSGKTNYNIVYLAEDNQLRSIYADAEWQGKTAFLGEQYFLVPSARENVVTGCSTTEITLSSLIDVDVFAITSEKVNTPQELDSNYVVCQKTHEYQRAVNVCSTSINLVQEEEVNKKVEDVLFADAEVVLESAIAGVDTVTLEGYVETKAYALCDGKVEAFSKKIDFKEETAILSALPSNKVDAELNISALKVTASVSDIDQKTNLIFSVEIACNIVPFQTETAVVIEDTYSLSKNINTSLECLLKENFEGKTNYTQNVVGSFDAGYNVSNILLVTSAKANITEVTKGENGNTLSGWIEVSFLCEGEGGEKINTMGSVGFAIENVDAEKEDHFSAVVNVLDYKIVSDKDIEFSANVVASVKKYSTEFVSYVSAVEEQGDKEENTSAIRVYIVKEGEDLFAVGKKLNMRPEDIAEQNKEAIEELSNGTRLVVYSPLTINFD